VAAVTVTRDIAASTDVVFHAVADPRRFADAIGGVTKLEFLSTMTSGSGTRFRQARAFVQRLLMPLVCLLIRRAVAKDIDAVKAYCESARQ
jgi:hypothetical protein